MLAATDPAGAADRIFALAAEVERLRRELERAVETRENANAATLCTYAKKQKIEIFSVAFIVANPSASADDKAKEDEAKTLLQGCATDAQHYYDATNSEALAQAFSGIAQSLTNVRLAR